MSDRAGNHGDGERNRGHRARGNAVRGQRSHDHGPGHAYGTSGPVRWGQDLPRAPHARGDHLVLMALWDGAETGFPSSVNDPVGGKR